MPPMPPSAMWLPPRPLRPRGPTGGFRPVPKLPDEWGGAEQDVCKGGVKASMWWYLGQRVYVSGEDRNGWCIQL